MTFPDPSLERTGERAENVHDVIPPSERNKDPVRSEVTQSLTLEGSRPLTEEERHAADREPPPGERVYAPASERVPVDPVPGHREVIAHFDTHTPEREAAGTTPEPSFTRVARPSTTNSGDASSRPDTEPGMNAARQPWARARQRRLMFGIMGFSWFTVACCGVAVWAFMRWRNERNKPINRLRRRARQAAFDLRDRVPRPEAAARPAMGLTTALLSVALVLLRQTQTRSHVADKMLSRRAAKARRRADKAARQAMHSISDVDWHKRLQHLKDRWGPGRLELEKISISRH